MTSNIIEFLPYLAVIAVKIKTENINVVEEEKLRIECSVLGNPYPALSWRIETSNYNGSDFDSRVEIKDYKDDAGNIVENGVLIIEKVSLLSFIFSVEFLEIAVTVLTLLKASNMTTRKKIILISGQQN